MAEKVKTTTKSSKAPVKKSSTSVSKQSEPSKVTSTPFNILKMDRSVKAVAIIVVVCILIFLLAYLFKGIFVAATVNGEPISRITVIKTLEKQSGKLVLDSLITKKLILQEADKRKIVVSKQDIDNEVKSISDNLKKQGTTLEKAMEGQSMTRAELDEEIKVQLALKKMTAGEVKVTDKEIQEFIKTNAASFPEGTTEDQMKTLAKTQLEQQKSGEKSQNLISELQKNAKIMHYAGY